MKSNKKTADKEGTAKRAGAEINFTLERETPGAVRFKELDSNGNEIESADDGAINTLYIRKAFLKRIGVKNVPDGCKVSITFE